MFASAARQRFLPLFVGVGLSVATGLGSAFRKGHANDDVVPPPNYPWSDRRPWQAFDQASVRRGYQVYKNVCSSCHSLSVIQYRNFVGNFMSDEEAKAEAAAVEVEDGPDDNGEMYMRPGKLTDPLPRPYRNDKEARATNHGALPPDLTLMVEARHNGASYLFSLLTGFTEPPAGVHLGAHMHYNPYFPGGQIAMEPPLTNDKVEYDDGTSASISQMAKDVTTFLNWTCNPDHDTRKRMGITVLLYAALMLVPTFYGKRMVWAVGKNKQVRIFR